MLTYNGVMFRAFSTDLYCSMQTLETDYLIIGAGAVGMAFADVILSETNANIIIVDRYHKPGGHWNDAYPFVTLHQPSAFYGVSSTELSSGRLDEVGLNKGMHELASGAEVLAYFDQVMRHRFLPSGRVQYFPMCHYQGNGQDNGEFSSIVSGQEFSVMVNKKIVDATYFKTSIPATHTPNFEIADGLEFIALNELPNLRSAREAYVVVGGGKTGVDACLWMLEHQIDASKIYWIMPRDGWWIDRQITQPGREFFTYSIGAQAAQMEAVAAAESMSDLFKRLEDSGVLMRLDESITPKMFHGATVSRDELAQLRRIKNVLRHGRVTQLKDGQIDFEHISFEVPSNTVFIDCSARAVPVTQSYPVFADQTITVQTVRSYQPVFSAAFIAHIEATYEDESTKNELCQIVPLPNHDSDWLLGLAAQMRNQQRWSKEPGLRDWMKANRLDGFTALMSTDDNSTPEELQILARIKTAIPGVLENMPKLAQEALGSPPR